jgi:hypothetical protein
MDYESHRWKITSREMFQDTSGQVTVTDEIQSKLKAVRTPAWRWDGGDKVPSLTEELLDPDNCCKGESQSSLMM